MATLKQIQARLKKLQAQAERLIALRAQAVLDDIRAMMERHGLTTDDIDAYGKRPRRTARPQVTLPAPAGRREAVTKLAKKGKLPAKYRNPETGETWSGWARPPAWIAGVKDRSKFLIDAEGTEGAVKPRKAAGKKVAARKSSPSSASTAAVKKAKAASTRAPAAKKASVTRPATKRGAPRKQTSNAAPKDEETVTAQPVAEPQPASNTSAQADGGASI
ncbi:H-NS histone family protein [Caballeronia ptereochthonis]|uniref:Histone family protein nucleoid-structuring protein H-NS n=1 Tax=Caballeronia ptereochthonis TaxID=1777144 RepID=A0A158BX09_9BURK|nr:H-NS histone family protein [Caballeronia ptereochthonis]SAK74633.1 histone family protein nucleoid-structuring protein H-NS [Caballeronia ptereochthonis]